MTELASHAPMTELTSNANDCWQAEIRGRSFLVQRVWRDRFLCPYSRSEEASIEPQDPAISALRVNITEAYCGVIDIG